MREKLVDARKSQALKRVLSGARESLPNNLPEAMVGQGKQGGESVFKTATKSATPDQVARAQRLTGLIDCKFCLHKYKATENPLWLWITVSIASHSGEIPPETFDYLKQVGNKFFEGFLEQLFAFERVQVMPGKDLQEGIVHLPNDSPKPPDIVGILGLSHPGRNPFRALASQFQALGVMAAVEDAVFQTGCSREAAHALVAAALGRTSPETGVSAETIRKIANKGKKLLHDRLPKPLGS